MRAWGVNWVAVIVAAIVHYLISFLIYGVLFTDMWIVLMGYTSETAEAAFAGQQWRMGLGVIMPILASVGLATLIAQTGKTSLRGAVGLAVLAWAAFGLSTSLYFYVYQLYPLGVFVMDGAHALISYVVVAAILAVWR